MSYEPLHHKYRPQTFSQLVGQDAIATTLSSAIKTQRIVPAYLFSGPRGTGKTSSARILAKSLNCLSTDEPTPAPCGQCEVCRSIANGSALDVVEIDAASNTGVDNIREIIERSQFAPVQCRHKVYVIDECLTGDSLILTEEGLYPIRDPELQGKKALSYQETTQTWEFKPIVRWLTQGVRETVVIRTENREIQCTPNHPVYTEAGWQKAEELQPGTKLLSPFPSVLSQYWLEQAYKFGKLAHYRFARSQKARENLATFDEINTNRLTDKTWESHPETVISIDPGETQPVYDLEVQDNHNFVANGLLVHNCHMLSAAAFNALLKTLEEPPERVVFVLATTDPQRVLPTIISRCQRFDFRRIPLGAMVAHLKKIADQENINIEEDAIALVAQIANGGLRDAESLLDQLSLLPDTITLTSVWDLVGAVPEQNLLAMLNAIKAGNGETLLDECRQLMDKGREPLIVLQNLASFYRDFLIAKTAPQRSDMVALTQPTWENLGEISHTWEVEDILRGQQRLKESEVQIKNTTQPRLWLEVTLLSLLPAAQAAQTVIVETAQPATRPASSPSQGAQPAQQSAPQNPQPQPAPTAVKQDSASQSSTPPAQTQTTAQARNRHQSQTSKSPAHAQPTATSGNRVQQIWQKVLTLLQPPTTRALVQQQCCLLDFDIDNGTACVGISSDKLYQLHKHKIPNIEAAFKKAWEQDVKVNMKVTSVTKPGTVVTSTQQTNKTQPHSSTPSQSTAVASTQPTSVPPKTSSSVASATSQPSQPTLSQQISQQVVSRPTQTPQTPTHQTTTHQPIQSTSQATATATVDTSEATSTVIGQEVTSDQIEKAVKSLADAFKGEVVTQGFDLYFPQIEIEQSTSASTDLPIREDEDLAF